MLQVYTCLTVDHDWRLVLLAVAVCLLASAVAISLFHRTLATAGQTRLMWLSLDAAAAGGGIWATHFIAMLAYIPAAGAGYNLTPTVLSLLIAMLIPGAGLALALLNSRLWTSAIGGAVVGGGIAVMHYTGMMALELPGRITWSPGLVIASIVFGIGFGSVTIIIAVRNDSWANTLLAVAALTLAIVTMHFTAMGAVLAIPDPTWAVGAASLSPGNFSLVVACTTAIILSVCLAAALSARKAESRLREQKDLLDMALENMVQGLCMHDMDGRIMLYNKKFAEMMGFAVDELHGKSLLDLVERREAIGVFSGDPQEYVAKVIASIREGRPESRTITSAGGRLLRMVEQPRADGGWVATVEDITEWQAAQEKISHMAHHDALTDLVNRNHLVVKLEELLAYPTPLGSGIAVHFINLDRFKKVNDSLGHDVGDFLLKTVAERLHAVTRSGDIVARIGGDEFVVVQTGVASKDKAEEFAHRLTSAVIAPMRLNDQTIVATVSVGVALAPADGTSPERLLKCADLALYNAKAEGRNCVRFFHPELDAELQERTRLEQSIRNAAENGGFELHYQPLFEMSNRRLVGFEALVRLPAEDGTLIPPLVFIPLAEELQLIDKIGAWVLREACRTAATWPDNLTVAVNLSPAQFLIGSVSDIVADALNAAGLSPHRLELEITETVLLGDSKAIMTELQKLKAMGVAIVMDDFGTGYSSLSYLWKFPFDKIKIDRSFMQGLDGTGRDAETVVRTIIALGRELNMRVTVEGVETAKQVAFLDDSDGDQVQGFFFGRPIPAAQISASILADYRKIHQAPAAKAMPESKLRLIKP